MRDPKRIDKILGVIKKIWEKHPDFRLGQLLCNVIPESAIYYVEDESILNALCAYYEVEPEEEV